MRSIGTVFLLVLWSDVPASAQPAGEAHKIDYETAPLERRLLAERCLGGIVVDGSLGEADWQSAPVATNFIQSEPREGAPATYDTEVRTLYNDDYLYFGVVAYDPEPDRIIINDLTRDFNPRAGDMFGVVLDTFRDLRNGYTFETNPMGAKFDGQFVNEGREFNRCLRCLLLVMCTHPFAKEALTLHLARSEGHERYLGCNLMHRKVLASSHQHLIAEAPHRTGSQLFQVVTVPLRFRDPHVVPQ